MAFAEVVDAIGEEAAQLLVERLGGTILYVPAKPSPKILFLGRTASILCKRFRGFDLYIPHRTHTKKSKVITLLEKNLPVPTIAKQAKVSRRYVHRVKSELK